MEKKLFIFLRITGIILVFLIFFFLYTFPQLKTYFHFIGIIFIVYSLSIYLFREWVIHWIKTGKFDD